MTAHEHDRILHHGLGIPDDPTEAEAKRVLLGLHIGKRFKWNKDNVPVIVGCLRWTDGYTPFRSPIVYEYLTYDCEHTGGP